MGKTKFADDVVLREYISRPGMVDAFNWEIGRIDVGVRALEVTSSLDGPQARFRHEGLVLPMPSVLESHGTRQFLKLYPLLSDTLTTGSLVIIDELDAAIRPMLLPEIIGWFHGTDRNRHSAQLWMSCHNASVLEDPSKDEIVLCDKGWRGRTETYCLNDVKAVRRDDSHHKKYLGGVSGGVPRIG